MAVEPTLGAAAGIVPDAAAVVVVVGMGVEIGLGTDYATGIESAGNLADSTTD